MSNALLSEVIEAGEDFEWYPTTQRMIDVVAKQMPDDFDSVMDIGAGDGRVLLEFAKRSSTAKLFAIEKSSLLMQAQPEEITPVGTDFFEQNLSSLPADFIFCNPPYSAFEAWCATIIRTGFARKAFLVIPRRWKESSEIAEALKARSAKARVIHSDDFHDAERRARAVVDIVEISFPTEGYYEKPVDPFDIWFEQNISTFDQEQEEVRDYEVEQRALARVRSLETIADMVEAYNEEYALMEENYRAIFKLDYALLRELGVKKEGVREGIKKRMAGLKSIYWKALFEKFEPITSRLSTATKKRFLDKLTGQASIAFTMTNAYAIALWAIKHANKYYDEQLVQLFRDLSTFEGVQNYKSNQKTWAKDGWRYRAETHDHYALDYRIVVVHYTAIEKEDRAWECFGGLHKCCHEQLDDVIAVLGNLGFYAYAETPSRHRRWYSGEWQNWGMADGSILFQVKAFKNGNLHFRFKPEAIRALNVEAGRLLGWLRSREDVVAELGYSETEAATYFGVSQKIGVSNLKLLAAPQVA